MTDPSKTAPQKLIRWSAAIVILVTVTAVFLLPFLWTVSSAFKDQLEIFRDVTPLSWKTFIPTNPTFDNFISLFTERDMGRALLNSLIISTFQVVGALVVCSLAAYALTRIKFRGRQAIFTAILVTFMLPAEAMVVPMYAVMADLELQDTLIAVALPWVANVFGLFLLRQNFEEIPMELDDAARLDGAGHFRIFWSIILPNVKTGLATLTLIVFLFSWNSFLWPLIVIQSPENMPVQVAVAQSFSPGELPNWGLTFAGATAATIPLIVLFLVLQRYFVRGLATSGLK